MNAENYLLFESIGVFMSQHCYLSFLSIAGAADFLAEETYETSNIIKLQEDNINIVNSAYQQLQKLVQAEILTETDLNTVVKHMKIYDVLNSLANACINMITDDFQKNLEIYESNRLNAIAMFDGLNNP